MHPTSILPFHQTAEYPNLPTVVTSDDEPLESPTSSILPPYLKPNNRQDQTLARVNDLDLPLSSLTDLPPVDKVGQVVSVRYLVR
jgi:hypothetical protein